MTTDGATVVTVVAHVRDLLFSSRIAETARRLGYGFRAARSLDDLRAALADQSSLLADYQAAGAQGSSALDVSREELRRIQAFSGESAVQGQGIIVNVTGSLDAIAVNDLVNELRNAGAEALALDDVRITAKSVVTQGATALEMDGTTIGRTFTVRAIGDPDGLIAALKRPGGIVTQLEQFVSATITVSPSSDLHLPATTLNLVPEFAESVE